MRDGEWRGRRRGDGAAVQAKKIDTWKRWPWEWLRQPPDIGLRRLIWVCWVEPRNGRPLVSRRLLLLLLFVLSFFFSSIHNDATIISSNPYNQSLSLVYSATFDISFFKQFCKCKGPPEPSTLYNLDLFHSNSAANW